MTEEIRITGLPEPIFPDGEGNDDFVKQLQSDYEDARRAIFPDASTESSATEARRTALEILATLYPLLQGKLYPKGASGDIAKKLLSSIEQGLPIVLCGVLAVDTALGELSVVTHAAKIFSDKYEAAQAKALVIDWPRLQDRSLLLGIASLTGDSTLVSRKVSTDMDLVRERWVKAGYSPMSFTGVSIGFWKKWQRHGSHLEMTGPADFVKAAKEVKNCWRTDENPTLKRDFEWFREFLERQRTMSDLTRPEIIAAAEFGLTVRRGVANRIQEMARVNRGLTLGITTEFNPNILRCYGKDILLANVDIR